MDLQSALFLFLCHLMALCCVWSKAVVLLYMEHHKHLHLLKVKCLNYACEHKQLFSSPEDLKTNTFPCLDLELCFLKRVCFCQAARFVSVRFCSTRQQTRTNLF